MEDCNYIKWMREALCEANKAFAKGEPPVGAVLVAKDGTVFKGCNCTQNNPLGHAELIVIDKAIKSGKKFLYDFTLYITLEPCLMCAGAIILSRVGKVVFGASDFKAGAVGSVYNCLKDKSFNHNPEVIRGVLKEECADLLQTFFKQRR